MLSEALPLLVLPCPAAVAELRQLDSGDAGAWLGSKVCRAPLARGVGHRQPLPFNCLHTLPRLCSDHPFLPPLPPVCFCSTLAGLGDVACFLRDVGLVVQFLCRRQPPAQGRPAPRYTAALRRCIAGKARRLAAAAAARGWAALAALLQPATAACEEKEEEEEGGQQETETPVTAALVA